MALDWKVQRVASAAKSLRAKNIFRKFPKTNILSCLPLINHFLVKFGISNYN
jgi:hypothetical protein